MTTEKLSTKDITHILFYYVFLYQGTFKVTRGDFKRMYEFLSSLDHPLYTPDWTKLDVWVKIGVLDPGSYKSPTLLLKEAKAIRDNNKWAEQWSEIVESKIVYPFLLDSTKSSPVKRARLLAYLFCHQETSSWTTSKLAKISSEFTMASIRDLVSCGLLKRDGREYSCHLLTTNYWLEKVYSDRKIGTRELSLARSLYSDSSEQTVCALLLAVPPIGWSSLTWRTPLSALINKKRFDEMESSLSTYRQRKQQNTGDDMRVRKQDVLAALELLREGGRVWTAPSSVAGLLVEEKTPTDVQVDKVTEVLAATTDRTMAMIGGREVMLYSTTPRSLIEKKPRAAGKSKESTSPQPIKKSTKNFEDNKKSILEQFEVLQNQIGVPAASPGTIRRMIRAATGKTISYTTIEKVARYQIEAPSHVSSVIRKFVSSEPIQHTFQELLKLHSGLENYIEPAVAKKPSTLSQILSDIIHEIEALVGVPCATFSQIRELYKARTGSNLCSRSFKDVLPHKLEVSKEDLLTSGGTRRVWYSPSPINLTHVELIKKYRSALKLVTPSDLGLVTNSMLYEFTGDPRYSRTSLMSERVREIMDMVETRYGIRACTHAIFKELYKATYSTEANITFLLKECDKLRSFKTSYKTKNTPFKWVTDSTELSVSVIDSYYAGLYREQHPSLLGYDTIAGLRLVEAISHDMNRQSVKPTPSRPKVVAAQLAKELPSNLDELIESLPTQFPDKFDKLVEQKVRQVLSEMLGIK